MTNYAQIFCTLADLETDLNLIGSEREETIWPKIKAASDYLQKEIGWFLPVTLARTLKGSGTIQQFIPPLLSVTSIVNDDDTLTTSDYQLGPDARHWPNGPYSWIQVLEDASNISTWYDYLDGVVITGKWGLYDCSKDTAADVATGGQKIDDTSLVATNGAKLSVGMVALIGDEQELVTATGSPTDSTANLGAAITDENTEIITLSDGAKVNIGEIIRVDVEQMKILDIAVNTAYVVRGWNKTLATTHSNAADVYVYRTFTVERGVNGTTAAAHDAAAAISQQCAPDDVNFLARQVAGKMFKLAQSGFAGKIGDQFNGEAIYQFAIPKDELERIKRNYMIPTAG